MGTCTRPARSISFGIQAPACHAQRDPPGHDRQHHTGQATRHVVANAIHRQWDAW